MLERNYVERPDSYTHSPFVEIIQTNTISVPTGVFTKIPLDTVLTNEIGCWDAINKWFVCPKAGRVRVDCGIFFRQLVLTGSTVAIELKVSNSVGVVYRARRFGQYNEVPATYLSLLGATVVNVNFGDRLWLEYYAAAATDMLGKNFDNTTEFTFLTMHYVI